MPFASRFEGYRRAVAMSLARIIAAEPSIFNGICG
jgi:hypothetical protein